MKLSVTVIIFLLLATNAYALSWSDATVSVPNGSEYNPDQTYGFQINWNGDGLEISEVIFEWYVPALDPSEFAKTNVTASNYSNTYYANLTNTNELAPEYEYFYRWFAVDNESNWNVTDYFSYILAKNTSASINLYLNGTQANKSYKKNEIANFTAKLNMPNEAIFLDSDYPGLNLNNDSSVIHFVQNLTTEGFFILNASWNGNIYYTGTSKVYYFDVGPPRFSNLTTEPLDYATYSPLANYSFNVTITDATLSEVKFESNFSGDNKNYTSSSGKFYNISNKYFANLTDLPAETFTYRWFAKDDRGDWSSTEKETYRIFKAYALLLYSPPIPFASKGTTTVVNCVSITNQIDIDDFDFYRNDTEIENTTQQVRSDISILPVGFYQYICDTDGNENYTNQTLKTNLTVLSDVDIDEGLGEFKIADISSPSIKVGENGQGTFKLLSTLESDVTDIKVNLPNIDSYIYTIEDVPSVIYTGGIATIKINFEIPDDYEVGEYESEIRATGKTDNGTAIAVGELTLTVDPITPVENIPPAYSDINSTEEDGETIFSFSLYDDEEVSGYIFSINDTGEWVNDTWTYVGRAVADISVEKRPDKDSLVAWKFFMNDSENAWTTSNEYYLERMPGFDYTIPIVVIVVFIITVVVFFVLRMRPASKDSPVFYVYSKDDIK